MAVAEIQACYAIGAIPVAPNPVIYESLQPT
jgi:hypothetical protein